MSSPLELRRRWRPTHDRVRPSTVRRMPAVTSRSATPATASVSGLHLITGAEDVLAERALAQIIAEAKQELPDLQVITVAAERYQAGDLTIHASPSLFAEGILLCIEAIDTASDELLTETRKLVELPVPDLVLVLRHKSGQRGKGLLDFVRKSGAQIHECPKITSDADKSKFVVQEFRRLGRKASPDAVHALVEALGQDVRELANACRQLTEDSVAENGKSAAIDQALVAKYYGGRVEATGFAVADAALAGHTDQALGLLRHALSSGVDPVPIVAVLAMGLRALAKVSSAGSARSADAARNLGMAPWQVDKARRQLSGWTPQGLAAAIEAVAAADTAVKGGIKTTGKRAGDPIFAVEQALLLIGTVRR